jgi:hypothetical protein
MRKMGPILKETVKYPSYKRSLSSRKCNVPDFGFNMKRLSTK